MPTLDFPQALAEGDIYNGPNGVIYTYVDTPPNGYWSGTFQNNTLDNLDTRYVEKDGDNMTGDLTLGTDNIVLDAGNGSAKFGGNIGVNGPAGGSTALNLTTQDAAHSGIVVSNPADTGNPVLLNIRQGTTSVASITGDGSAEFAGYVKAGDYNGSSDDTTGVIIYKEGTLTAQRKSTEPASTVFSGKLGSATTSTIRADGQISSGDWPSYGINLNSIGTQSIRRDSSPAVTVFQVYNGGTGAAHKKIEFQSDGSAQFAGTVESNITSGYAFKAENTNNRVFAGINISGNEGQFYLRDVSTNTSNISMFGSTGAAEFAGGATEITSTGIVRVSRSAATNDCFEAQLNGTANAVIKANGDATFEGEVKTLGGTVSPAMTLMLDPDNDANYTTTTETYTEEEELTPYVPAVEEVVGPLGNVLVAAVPAVEATYHTVTKTRDVSTYTGPTLDVKDRLQNLITRIDAIESDELSDDATSTLLLTTVNNLNADMTKTKAALVAIRTAANAAGTLEQLKSDIATATADIV